MVAPVRFGDAKEIGDHMRQSNPVIVNLQQADRTCSARMIDFCSGIAYALSCEMERVADQVFLLTPNERHGLGRGAGAARASRLQHATTESAIVTPRVLIEIYLLLLIARALLSWFQDSGGEGLRAVNQVLAVVTEPVLKPVRSVIRPVGRWDLPRPLDPGRLPGRPDRHHPAAQLSADRSAPREGVW